jgi:plasmid stabilization system protein ParE
MKLVWTRKAKLRLEAILNHIESEFGRTTRNQFRTRTKEFTSLLAKFPEIGEVEVKEKRIRGFQITKQTRVFYRLTDTRITILTLFDSRQDPGRRPR